MRVLLALAVLFAGCGLTTQVRPTAQGVLAVQAAVGGPMVNVGAPVPLPLGTLGVAYGVHPRADVSLHTHLTTLAVSRVFGLDLGGSVLALEQHEAAPALTFGVRGYVFTDFKSAALGIAEASTAVSWDVGRFRLFVAVAAQLDFQALQLDFAPALGTEIRFGRFTLVVDLKWFAPTRDTTVSSAPWIGLGGHGALGLVLGGRFDFRL